MKGRNYKYYLRKAHRYLGIFIGIQFIFWTLGGLYFSWTSIEQVRGDDLRNERESIVIESAIDSPRYALDAIRRDDAGARITELRLVEIRGESFYSISVQHSNATKRAYLARSADGRLRGPVTEPEARLIAVEGLKNPTTIVSTEYMTAEMIGADHEYREKPMPAWVVTFEGDLNVYVSAETGQIGAVRNTRWRIFDFLWMLHTLDYKSRDDINNYLLRGFSLVGIVTITSGFALFFVSSPALRRRIRRQDR